MIWFMDERFWLPDGIKWSMLQPNGTARYPQPSDLKQTIKSALFCFSIFEFLHSVMSLLLYLKALCLSVIQFRFGVVLLFIRIFMECFVFLPIGKYFGWIDAPDGLTRRIVSHMNFGFAGKSKYKRVAETAWRFTYYVFAWTFGIIINSIL